MMRALYLASFGIRKAAPNPSVGAVLVYKNKIIGQGSTSAYGGNHAEVNCLNSVSNQEKNLIKDSTLYVSLEPCNHQGKTPPCSELIIKNKIKNIVIACQDPFKKVNGKSTQLFKEKNMMVSTGVLEKEALFINRRFFTFIKEQRPYIILKWAQTQSHHIQTDLANKQTKNNISNLISRQRTHIQRSKEQAVLIGTNTALNDNPKLNIRHCSGENPNIFVLDLNNRLPSNLTIFKKENFVFTYQQPINRNPLSKYLIIDKKKNLLKQINQHLYQLNILSIIVEGGAQTINTFLDHNLWDEALVITAQKKFETGIKSPVINKHPDYVQQINTDTHAQYFNTPFFT